MKQVIVGGLFTILAAVITGIFTWLSATEKYKDKIKDIKETTISKEEVTSNYIEKSEYEILKEKITNKELSLVQENYNTWKFVDSLKKELEYLRLKCEKIAKIAEPAIKFKEDKMLFELDKVYQEGKYIVLNLRLTNLDNDKKYGLDYGDTVIQTPQGYEYYLKDVLKGGKNVSFNIKYEYKHKEDILYTFYFGDVSSQLKFDRVTFKTITRNGTKINKEIKISSK